MRASHAIIGRTKSKITSGFDAGPLWNFVKVRLSTPMLHSTTGAAKHTRMTPHNARVMLLMDWDSTLTKKDTMSNLAAVAQGALLRTEATPPWWQTLVDAYVSDFEAHKATARASIQCCTPKEERDISQTKLALKEERAWLASLSNVERRSFDRAKATGKFDKVNRELLENGVESLIGTRRVDLRDGWQDLLVLDQVMIAVISVNWSTSFIRACLRHKSKEVAGSELVTRAIDQMNIVANEIFNQFALPDMVGIHTSRDKLETSKALTAHHTEAIQIVYIGDSVTDLDCLVEADVGICVRDETMSSGQRELAETLQRVGIDVCPISELIESSESVESGDGTKKLWWTDDLSAITVLVKGLTQQLPMAFIDSK